MTSVAPEAPPAAGHTDTLAAENAALRERVAQLEHRIRRTDERRRAMVHIMGDLAMTNRRLSDQRRAMIHILSDYEKDRSRLARQTERLDNSRRALLHILQDSHQSNLKLETSRKAMIHIMGDLADTTEEVRARERELREKQEQLVQAGKLATLGELTTGMAHELNNPLNNIGLFIGNVIDQLQLGLVDKDRMLADLGKASKQVMKASEIISHLRTFGRVAVISREAVDVNEAIRSALSLMQEQLRLRLIEVTLDMDEAAPQVLGNPIQLEQVFINLLANARDAVSDIAVRKICVSTSASAEEVTITVKDSGAGIPEGLEQRIFDPFFTTKDVGKGTGLGLSITYSIIKEHAGDLGVENGGDGEWGAIFTVTMPLLREKPGEEYQWATES